MIVARVHSRRRCAIIKLSYQLYPYKLCHPSIASCLAWESEVAAYDSKTEQWDAEVFSLDAFCENQKDYNNILNF